MNDDRRDSQLRLSDLFLGEIDAKNEILKQSTIDASAFRNGFLIPSHYDPPSFDNGGVMFVVGFKGTGKTSFLRWLGDKKIKDGSYAHFILFKSDILEEDRQAISRGVWFEFLPTKRTLSGIDQDFKYAWSWILIEKIFESLVQDRHACIRDREFEDAAKIIGHDVGSGRSVLLKRHLSIMPKLTSGKVEISAKSPVVDGSLGLEFATKDTVLIPFGELVRAARTALSKIKYTGKKVYIFVDELESFSTSQENFERDIRMIRDLLFAVYDLNSKFREWKIPIFIIAAVRSEVLAVVNKTGEEVGRNVEDFAFRIDWSEGKRGPDHPLIRVIHQKIKASEIQRWGGQKNFDTIKTYFQAKVDNAPIANYLLDSSMYRPRDIMRRLGLAKRKEPNAWQFRDTAFTTTYAAYSRQMWQEASEELVPGYSPEEVVALERAMAGFGRYFYFRAFEAMLSGAARNDDVLKKLLEKHNAARILQDFFRIGIVGNNFVVGDANRTQTRTRWAFRGDTTLALERRMTFHKSLWPCLTLVHSH